MAVLRKLRTSHAELQRRRGPKASQRCSTRLRAATGTVVRPPDVNVRDKSHETDVVIIGSGIGGLCCAALLARYGFQVTVCESHYALGGAAHTWKKNGYHFESGPSLYSGMASKGAGANPLALVLQAVGEELDLIQYDSWNVFLPEGKFLTRVGSADNFPDVLASVRGPDAVAEWARLKQFMKPYAKAASTLPPIAMRYDPGVAITAVARYLPQLLGTGAEAAKLTAPFSKLIDGVVSDVFVQRWLDLLCFLLSGLPANGTIAAEVAFMFNEWYKPGSCLDFPRGGAQAMVDALARGVTKRGGRILTSAHVDQVIVERGRAVGVQLRGGSTVRARKAVISNASVWDTQRLLPGAAAPSQWRQQADATPACPSFMHLHVGFDAAGLEAPDLHHIIVNDWERGVDSEQNVVLVSIASVVDPALAPAGKHCLHAYLPATEPYGIWKGLDRKSPEYAALKEERSRVLWEGVERIVPDIRQRAEVVTVGTPLTHERFLRRDRGSYGPAIKAGQGMFPGPTTPIPGLYCCGDSTFPGIGLPAVAASGAICANTLAPVWSHWQMLEELSV